MLTYTRQKIQDKLDEILMTKVGELNDQVTRQSVINEMSSWLSDMIKDRDYYVICDETNNTTASIDSNMLSCDIFIEHTSIRPFCKISRTIGPDNAFYMAP